MRLRQLQTHAAEVELQAPFDYLWFFRYRRRARRAGALGPMLEANSLVASGSLAACLS